MNPLNRLSDALRHHALKRRALPARALARRGEDLAHRYLESRGYRVVARNYCAATAGNEVDIVAWHADRLVFVEVKSRAADEAGTPDRAVDARKRQKILRAAAEYARRANVPWDDVRFDIVAVLDGLPPYLELFEDAFGKNTDVKFPSVY